MVEGGGRSRRQNCVGAALILLLVFDSSIAAAATIDVPIAGKSLALGALPAGTQLTFKSDLDPAVSAPFPDPRAGASLFVFASSAPGHCRAEIELPAAGWSAIGKAGAEYGWRYKDVAGLSGGVRKVVVRGKGAGGRILIKAEGTGFPCGLEADAQRTPISVVLRIADTRYCASFGGAVKKNVRGAFKAREAARPPACPDEDITVATLNVVHGVFCPAETDFCRIEDRIDLLGEWIVARGCPGVLAFQEVFDLATRSMAKLMAERLVDVCPVRYEVVYVRRNGVDDSLILTRYPSLVTEIGLLHGPLRNVLFARVDHPLGPVDVYSTHLASGSDGGPSPCTRFGACPAECVTAGAVTVRDCQAVQIAGFVEQRHGGELPAFLLGDFNARPETFVYDQFADRGWVDTTRAAGNPECNAATGVGCTSGREDEDVTDVESPALNVDTRIDYAFLIPPGPGSHCSARLDSPDDGDGDGVATRLFADEPNPFSPMCGPAPAPICWVSDHNGAQADVNCRSR